LNRLPGINVQVTELPPVSPKVRKQINLLKYNKRILPTLIARAKRDDEEARYYDLNNLNITKPVFIILNSKYFNRFMRRGNRNIYPNVTKI